MLLDQKSFSLENIYILDVSTTLLKWNQHWWTQTFLHRAFGTL
jgi:hypothetical protein